MVYLNDRGLDDAKLALLINKVPPGSLIVFEEIEKQLNIEKGF